MNEVRIYRKAAKVAKGRKVMLKNRIPDLLCIPSRPLRLCGSMNVMLFMGNGMTLQLERGIYSARKI